MKRGRSGSPLLSLSMKENMCLYPKYIKNRKYTTTKKNGGNVPNLPTWEDEKGHIQIDDRILYVPVGCGNCIECRKQKARSWQVRLHEELKATNGAQFVTLTFSPEQMEMLCKLYQLTECNALCGKAIRLFLERYRKKYGHSCKHWLITELGHTGTERIHIHGLIWCNKEDIKNMWSFGNTWVGEYVNKKTVNYIVKYVTKIDHDHKDFKQQIFASQGLGKSFIDDIRKQEYKYRPNNTKEWYTLTNGYKLNLPIYYRNQLYSEEEREMLWREKLDKKEIYIRGVKYSVKTEEERLAMQRVLEKQQEVNESLGYGNRSAGWKAREYNITLRMLNAETKAKQNNKLQTEIEQAKAESQDFLSSR